MDPIALNLRTERLPPASDPVGGELAAAEVDENVLNLRTACEQLNTEKVGVEDLDPVTEVASAQNTDLLLMERAGAPVKAPVSTLPQPAPVATAVRDALASLSGTDRLDASAIQNLPAGAGIPDAPSDGMDYARRDAAWQALPKFISLVKLADETRSNNTFAADGTLQAELEANSVYRLEIMLRFRGGTAEDFRFRVNRTGLSDAELRFAGDLDNNSAATLTWTSAVNCAVAAAGTNYLGNYIGVVITGADPGTLILEWAQQVTGATAATLAAGSMLMLRQVYREAPDTAPAAFTVGQWSLTPIAGGFRIGVTALPDDGGSALTDLERLIEGGSWTSMGAATIGDYDVTGLAAVETDVQIRAVNAIGNGDPSDIKTDTPLAAGGSGLSLEGDSGYNAISIYLGPDNTVPIPATVAEGDTVFLFVQEFFVAGSLGSVVDDQAHAYTDVTPVGWPAGMRLFRSETITAGTMPTAITLPYTGGDYIASGRCFVARGTISTVTGFTDTTGFTADPHVIDYTTTVNDAIVFGQNIWTGGGVTGSTPDGLHAWVQTDPDTPSSSYSFLREVATAGAATATITPVGSGTGSEAYGVIIQAAA